MLTVAWHSKKSTFCILIYAQFSPLAVVHYHVSYLHYLGIKESVSFIDQGVCVGAEARLSVPRLLSVMGDSADAREEWRTGWQGVPLQALLPWAAQMLSLLSQAEGDAMLPTLKVCHLPSSSSPTHFSGISRF